MIDPEQDDAEIVDVGLDPTAFVRVELSEPPGEGPLING